MKYEVTAERLRKTVDPDSLQCSTTEELTATPSIIGQERATRSLQFGLGIKAYGFNIFVAGLPGTGRTTAVTRYLKMVAQQQALPPDWCYVRNFNNVSRPNAIRLPAGRAKQFQADMKVLVENVQKELRKVFESEDYATRRKEVASTFEHQGEEILSRLNTLAQQQGFIIQQTPTGVMTVPLKDGHPMTQEEFMNLSHEERDEISKHQEELQGEIETAVRHARSLEKNAVEEVQRTDQQVALYALNGLLTDIKTQYRDIPEVLLYLEQVQADILANLDSFRGEQKAPENENAPIGAMLAGAKDQLFRRYAVNVLVDNSSLEGAPVVMELNPTYTNLFGRIENEAQFGTLVTDFSLIRKGSLHSANGGYLVIPVEELLRNPFSWESLKRALKNHQIVIEDPTERIGVLTTRSLQPQPVPLDVKIILIGQPTTYHLLRQYDEDFSELFKVKADFDNSMHRTPESMQDYILFTGTLCQNEELKAVDCTGLARIIEYGSRLADSQQKLTTHFGAIADLLREANYYASLDNSQYITAIHIQKAIEEKVYRSNLAQEKIQELSRQGILLISVEGEAVGQVNGLSVIDLGDIRFGQPNRITASVGVGREGLINIEREANLSGPIHTKGVLILSGYLISKYAQDKPVSLSARLVFEQSYSGVEGDSASSAELYAILSALSGQPIHQSIAVTGSVNQRGEVQAIGGINEKVEGFFEVCKFKNLTGQQGVMLPAANLDDLMLKEEVVEAVRQGQFHIWAVNTIDEGIEVLTNCPAGKRVEPNGFEIGTVNDLVDKRLRQLAQILTDFGRDDHHKIKETSLESQ